MILPDKTEAGPPVPALIFRTRGCDKDCVLVPKPEGSPVVSSSKTRNKQKTKSTRDKHNCSAFLNLCLGGIAQKTPV